MACWLRTVWRVARGNRPRLVCSRSVWNEGVNELRRRSAAWRESGAFLLGTVRGHRRRVEGFLFYDDVDPHCFARGIVEFDGRKLGLVWRRCREEGRTVIADVHVHPGSYHQSESDRHNPIIAEPGHLALIIPQFAAAARMPGGIGIYEYLGARQWRDHSAQGAGIFRVGGWLL